MKGLHVCLFVTTILVASVQTNSIGREKRATDIATGVCGDDETKVYTKAIVMNAFKRCPIDRPIDRTFEPFVDACEHWMGSRPLHVASSSAYDCIENKNADGFTLSVTIKATVCCKGIPPANRCLTYSTCAASDPGTCDYQTGAVVTCAADERCETRMECGTGSSQAKLTKSCVKTCSSDRSCAANTYMTVGQSCADCCTSAFCNRGGRTLSCYTSCSCGDKISANSHCDSSGVCVCNLGCSGARCENCAGTCNPNPCHNGGRCQLVGASTSCCCTPGYGGTYCDKALDACDRSRCSNHGDCKLDGSDMTCVCDAGYYGGTCQNAIASTFSCPNPTNIYTTTPTPVKSTCSDLLKYNALSKTSELSGCKYYMRDQYGNADIFDDGGNGHVTAVTNNSYDYCNTDECGYAHHRVKTCCPSCYANPCQNKGYCLQIPFTGQATDYVCRCKFGFTGQHCEKRISTCWAYGEPHYITYDGQPITYHGICRYILTMYKGGPSLEAFAVYTKNEHRGSDTTVAFPQYAEVVVYGYRVRLGKNNVVTVQQGNGPVLPVSLNVNYGNKISVTMNGRFVRLETDFGLVVQYDGNNMMFVQISDRYQGLLSGICNNMDSDASNDLRDCRGVQRVNNEQGFTEYGDSCLDPDYTNNTRSCETHPPPPCDVSKYSSNNWCGYLYNTDGGPFGSCAQPNAFESCKYDLCRNESLRCSSMENFAAGCSYAGQLPDSDWREQVRCPMACPVNSHYEFNGSACQPTCEDPSAHLTCDYPDTEVCVCNDGMILRDGTCVYRSQCGCKDDNNVRRKIGETWGLILATCTQKKCVQCTTSGCKYPGKIVDETTPPINGGWGNWSKWSTCDTATNLMKRSRSCDQPKPQCGGLGCTGGEVETKPCPTVTTPATTTTTTPSPTPTPPPCASGFDFARACAECRNALLYIANPCTCRSYFQCHLDEFGMFTTTTMPCAPCTCWNQRTLTCEHDSSESSCPTIDVPDEIINRRGAECVVLGLGYVRTFETVPGDNTHYYDMDAAGHDQLMPCPGGTVFDVDSCRCVQGHHVVKQREMFCLDFDDLDRPFRTTTGVWVKPSIGGLHSEKSDVKGYAMRFNGGFLSIPAYKNKEVRELTIVLWYKRDWTRFTGQQALISNDDCKKESAASIQILSRSLTSVGGGIRTINENRLNSFLESVPNDRAWHFVAMTYSMTSHLTTFYLDGKTRSVSASGPIATQQCDMLIGSMYDSSYFYGLMDEICFYDYAFTASEVGDLYRDQRPSSPLPGYTGAASRAYAGK